LPWEQAAGGGAFVVPVNTVAPVISGTMQIGQTLTGTTGTWTGTPAPAFTYQWKRAGVSIGGATASTYVQIAADEGPAITLVVLATNAAGSASATSNTKTYTFATDTNILDGVLGSQYVSGTNWPTIKAVGTATINNASRVTASTLAGKASVASDGNTAGYVTITGLGTALSGQSGCSVYAVMQTNQATLAAVWEYVSGANMAMDVHDSDTGEILPTVSYWTTWNTPNTDTIPAAWGWHFNRLVSSGTAGVRYQGGNVTTAQHGVAGTPGGNFASGNLVLFNRSDHAIGTVCNLSIFLLTTSVLAPTSAAALTIEAALSFYGGV
jgi:hypothetical protein